MSMVELSTNSIQAAALERVCVDRRALPSSLRPNLFSGD
jgi:hypothetical protein